jgi:D-alanyl-D-alanine dipeptidase
MQSKEMILGGHVANTMRLAFELAFEYLPELQRYNQTDAARLCVLDAARPHRVQELFWTHVHGTPMERYFANPARRSIHSFGMAVDLTLLDAEGHELDMGTGFDDTTELSHPALEDQFAAQGRLQPEHLRHRAVLRHAMQHGGWQGIATEWWHFDFGDRDAVRACYRLIV